MKKPEYITKNDWFLLEQKYKNKNDFLEKKLSENYPVQYLIGFVDFCGYKIEVNENVLIPRFETEELVAKTIKYIKKLNLIDEVKILDIGTGSGCISIALAKELPKAKITAIDISRQALKLAKKNAKNNGVKIDFIFKDILKEPIDNYYDIVISNPPYVGEDEPVDNCVKYEPQNAIFSSPSTLFYDEILKKTDSNTKLIALEIGISQVSDLKLFTGKYFPVNNLSIEKDLTGRDRYVFITVNE